MSVSRDDFSIAFRSALLQRGASQKFSVLSLIFLALIIFFLDVYGNKFTSPVRGFLNDVVYRISYLSSTPTRLFPKATSNISSFFNVREENKRLKETIEKYKSLELNVEYLTNQNQDLQKIISTSLSNNFSGFIVSNTMKGNSKGISGGISGDLLKNKSCEILRKVQGLVGNEVILIASGGISTKVDVEERLDNGAKLIQIYTSFVYRGPTIVNELLN